MMYRFFALLFSFYTFISMNVAKADCPLSDPTTNAYPFTPGCPLPAAALNAALAGSSVPVPQACDGFSAFNGSIIVGTQTFSSTSANFAASAVGKRITISGAGTAGASLVTTITAVVDTANVTLADTASNTVSGAMWGYGTDYSAQINAALAHGVQLPVGICGIASSINYGSKNTLLGRGSGTSGAGATTLMWLGAVGGTQLAGDTGAAINSATIGNFNLDGMCAAATGVTIRGLQGSLVYPILAMNQTAAGIDVGVSVANNIQNQDNTYLKLEAVENAACSAAAKGIVFGGTGTFTVNTNHNVVLHARALTTNGTGFEVGNADTNRIVYLHSQQSGTGKGVDFLAGDGATNHSAQGNSFGLVSSTGPINFTTGTDEPFSNTLDPIETVSGEPCPPTFAGTTATKNVARCIRSAPVGWDSALAVTAGGTGRTTLTAGQMLFGNAGAAPISIPLINYGSGCTLSNDGASPNTVIDIAPCQTADDGSATPSFWSALSAYTKTTAAFVAGTGNGGLDTGAVAANTWYYIYHIGNSLNGDQDYLLTATYGSPTLPGAFNRKRYIGAVKTAAASTNILAFKQIGNNFVWATPSVDVNGSSIGTSASTQTLSGVPSGRQIIADLRVQTFKSASNPIILLSSLDETDAAPNTPTGNATLITTITGQADVRIRTNTTQGVRARSSLATTSLWINTVGWTDPLLAWPRQ